MFNRSCRRSHCWSDIKGCFWIGHLGPWWSVGWKVHCIWCLVVYSKGVLLYRINEPLVILYFEFNIANSKKSNNLYRVRHKYLPRVSWQGERSYSEATLLRSLTLPLASSLTVSLSSVKTASVGIVCVPATMVKSFFYVLTFEQPNVYVCNASCQTALLSISALQNTDLKQTLKIKSRIL